MTRNSTKESYRGCNSLFQPNIAALRILLSALFSCFSIYRATALTLFALVAFTAHVVTFPKIFPDISRTHTFSQLSATTEHHTPATAIRETNSETIQEIERLDIHGDALRRHQTFDCAYGSNFQYLSDTHWQIAEQRLISYSRLHRSLHKTHKGRFVRFPIPPPAVVA